MKERVKKVNYAEVDSDVDLDEEEREVERMKQQQLDQVNNNNQGKERWRYFWHYHYNSKLLLDLPFDLFAEVCSHLDGKDLLALAKVNTIIRNLLLSRSSRSIWSALRRKLGYPLPAGFNELDFALFEYSKICQMCGSRVKYEELTAYLRKRFCHKCYLAQTISSKGLKSAWPDLHPAASQCVRSIDKGPTWMGNSSATRYLTSDLNAVDTELKELEERDELAVSLSENQASKGSSTRSRRSNNNAVVLGANHVENFIKEKQKWVKSEQQVELFLFRSTRGRLEKLEREAVAARRKAIEARRESFLKSLEDNHGWQHDEADYLWYWNDELAPKVSIGEDPDAWSQCRLVVREKLDKRALEYSEAAARGARRALIRPYYDTLKLQGPTIIPSLWDFERLQSIRPLWEPESAVVSDEIWEQIQPELKEELEKYEEKCRVEAIRAILAANQGLSSSSSLSKDPADYPESIYDDNFFTRITSHFVSWQGRWSITVCSYPEMTGDQYFYGFPNLDDLISPRQILIIRSLVEAAGFNLATTSYSDLGLLEPNFVWVNGPRKKFRERKIKRSWINMLHHALRRGPSQRKIAQGERFDFEYRPDLDEDDDDEDSQPSDSDAEDEEEEETGDGQSEAGPGEEQGAQEDAENVDESDED
ncbi:hypothetical protein JCM3765_001633 [Sporobolomyces pararoseus]